MNPEIILASEGDLEAISTLEERCFSSPFPLAVLYEDICVSKHPYFIAKYDGKIIGYGGMYIIIDEAYILNICILPEYRGNGYGKMLLKSMMSYAAKKGALSMTLEVRVSNAIALELYKDLGFTVEAIRPNYYEDTGEDAYIMWKQGIEEQAI